ncbi:unnamed protein product [Sphenostylis stenocarpa]|uniref:Uncharacterized protein n=1 Tax=Sphenostylis stenocarpa TaxID=92480 RepID=A0AA87B9E1_9FABA|nr:unnamed protein product [Sphenostylis stenocarpa]
MASFARGAASLTRIGLSSSKTPIQHIHLRGLAGAAVYFTLCIRYYRNRSLCAVRFAFCCASASFCQNLGIGGAVESTVGEMLYDGNMLDQIRKFVDGVSRTEFGPLSMILRSTDIYHHGPAKVALWKDPMSPSKWKEEHFVIVSLAGWGLLFYGGYKLFTGGKGKKEEVKASQ